MKNIIAWILRNIPRPVLQVASPFFQKLLGLLLRGNKVTCPVNGKSYRKFLPYGRINPRANAFCPESLTLERHRLLWLFLKKQTTFFQTPMDVLHIAPEACFMKAFEAIHKDRYITADIESPLAKVKMDVHDIPFEANTFDFVICNHVLEHVDDDIKAISEIHRVLRPGGSAILQVPFFPPLVEKTIQDITIKDPKKRESLFGQDDHVRKYGKDYGKRLATPGFTVEENRFIDTFTDEEIKRYGLMKDESIWIVTKGKPHT